MQRLPAANKELFKNSLCVFKTHAHTCTHTYTPEFMPVDRKGTSKSELKVKLGIKLVNGVWTWILAPAIEK